MEPEVGLPVKCPVCGVASLSAYRFSVVADALTTGQIRLYAGCHVAGWDATESELDSIRDHFWKSNSASG